MVRELKETRVIDEVEEMNEDAREFVFKLVPDLFKLYKVIYVLIQVVLYIRAQ